MKHARCNCTVHATHAAPHTFPTAQFIKTLLLTPFLTGTCDAAADGDNAPTNMRMTVPTTTAPVKEPPVPHVVLPPLRTADRHGGRSRAAERYMDVLGHLETLIDQHREHWHEVGGRSVTPDLKASSQCVCLDCTFHAA